MTLLREERKKNTKNEKESTKSANPQTYEHTNQESAASSPGEVNGFILVQYYYTTIIHKRSRDEDTETNQNHPLVDQAAQLDPRPVQQRHHQPVESYGTRDS